MAQAERAGPRADEAASQRRACPATRGCGCRWLTRSRRARWRPLCMTTCLSRWSSWPRRGPARRLAQLCLRRQRLRRHSCGRAAAAAAAATGRRLAGQAPLTHATAAGLHCGRPPAGPAPPRPFHPRRVRVASERPDDAAADRGGQDGGSGAGAGLVIVAGGSCPCAGTRRARGAGWRVTGEAAGRVETGGEAGRGWLRGTAQRRAVCSAIATSGAAARRSPRAKPAPRPALQVVTLTPSSEHLWLSMVGAGPLPWRLSFPPPRRPMPMFGSVRCRPSGALCAAALAAVGPARAVLAPSPEQLYWRRRPCS